jgi:hypothetical protein
MRLGFIFLNNVANINRYEEVSSLTVSRGNATTIYLQLVDLDQVLPNGRYRRYIPVALATAEMAQRHIDSTKCHTRVIVNPFAEDRSIWALPILATDSLPTNGIEINLTEAGVVSAARPVGTFSVMGSGSGTTFA